MAKITGPQDIPSEDLDNYRAALGEKRPDGTIEKRMPFRFPQRHADHADETPAMRAQRTRFKDAVAKFSLLSRADRERWYARMPPWSSYLWYYNWFMLNAIPNLWQAVPGGDAVLNNIQTIKTSLAIAGGLVNIPSTVVATKCVVMLNGNGYNYGHEMEGDYPYAWCWPVYPVLSSISNTQIDLRWASAPLGAALVSATLIEYI